MTDGLKCSINPDIVTVGTKVSLTFTMENTGEEDITFYNSNGYDISMVPDIGSGEELKDTTYFYLYFKYGNTTDALTEEDGESIVVKLNCEGWDVRGRKDEKLGYYWILMPLKTVVWKSGMGRLSDTQAVIIFSGIICNKAVGTTRMTIKKGRENETEELSINKIAAPKIENLRIISKEPYMIGEKGILAWNLEDYTEFSVKLDGRLINQTDSYHEEEVEIKYDPFTLEVVNRIGTMAQKQIKFPVNIITKFKVLKLTPEQAELSWKIENAYNWGITRIVTMENMKAEDTRTFQIKTEGDRIFEIYAYPNGTTKGISDSIEFACPQIQLFEVLNSIHTETCRIPDDQSCEVLLQKYEKNGFLSPELVHAHKRGHEDTEAFNLACKGDGGGPTKYDYTYRWSGKNVLEYYVKMNDGTKAGPFGPNEKGCTITTTSTDNRAKLTAVGSFGYTVEKEIK